MQKYKRTGEPCDCYAHLPKRPLIDARGIFCCYVCDGCEADRKAMYCPEVFTDPNYYAPDLGDDEGDDGFWQLHDGGI